MPIPLNRLVAFAGPYVSIVAATIATWLVAKLNALGIPGIDGDELAQQVGAALTFTLVSALTWLGQSQWLNGHHVQMQGDAALQAAALVATTPPPPHAGLPPDPEHDALMALGEGLPTDEEEFGMPPGAGPRFVPEIGA